jgi:hypothetical protein
MIERSIHLYSDGITSEQSQRYGMQPVVDISATVACLLKKHGEDSRWAVVTDGPLLVLRVRTER